MKKKIVCILVCMLLIATTATASVTSNEEQEIESSEIREIDDYKEDIESTGGWEECMEACLGIAGLAGNCLYVIVGCAVFPGPWNPCCLVIPLFCGIDIGLFFGFLSRCADASNSPSGEEVPCSISPIWIKIVRFLQNNNPSPLFFLGVLCLLQRLKDIIEWLREHGYPIPENYDVAGMLREKQNYHIDSSVTGDCGCSKVS